MSKNEELKEIAKPLVEYIRKNYHPHTTIIIDCVHAEVLEGVAVMNDETKEEIQAILTLLKRALVKNGVSMALHDNKIAFFDTDTYIREHKLNGFETDLVR